MYIRNPYRNQLSSTESLIPVGKFSRDYAVDRIVELTGLERQKASYLFADAIKSGDVWRLGTK